MKRILLPAGGAVLASGLLAAGLAGTAQAAPTSATDPLANNTAAAQSVAQYWSASNNAALKSATAYYHDASATGWKSGGGYSPDGKPGAVLPTGEEKVVPTKVKNINLPKNIGKVFWTDKQGKNRWASGASIQSKYRNLVVTAAHNVYDTAGVGDADVLKNWVFVPGYYQGKTPYGIYVGKTAWTHYDFDVYEDYDRDYAFVTVYNGVFYGGDKVVTAAEYDKFVGPKYVDVKEVSAEEGAAGLSKYGPEGPYYKEDTVATNVETVNPPQKFFSWESVKPYLSKDGKDGVKLLTVEVSSYDYEKAPHHTPKFDNGEKAYADKDSISQETYKQLLAEKAAGKFLGELTAKKDKNGTEIEWYKTQYFIKKWVKSTTATTTKWFVKSFHIELSKDAGRLGDNVGGQGFAWNQKTGQPVFIFGYPEGPHPDGDKPYTGITPKWVYGKTSGKVYVSAAQKIEEHIGVKGALTPGADGGPWVLKYNNNKRLGYVNGVTSQFGDQDGNGRYDLITSAYFDGETADIYKKAANVWSGKIVGPNGELYK
ncbi:trypsin-like serine peptidase [Streptosporangium sp. NPDC001559]|uniref:trypsin-like serine peptidase n=1 Tax=Streptosporangium sp. NPDC001559 TaxID=3366187 RepID=UPI0036E1517B